MSTIEVRDNGIYVCPIGKDGKFIRPGETLYGNDGKAWEIKAVGPTFCYADEAGRSYRLRAEWLTHERPDSWERLTEELRDAGESSGIVCAYYGHADDETCRRRNLHRLPRLRGPHGVRGALRQGPHRPNQQAEGGRT